jgi:hypothetical protein
MGPSAPGLNELIRKHLPMECVEELIPVARAHNSILPTPPAARRPHRDHDEGSASDA